MPRKPAKKAFKKKGKAKTVRRKPFKQNREIMVNRMPRASHSVIAPHFYTSIEAGFYGVVGATAGTSSGQFAIHTNSAYLPFYNAGGDFTMMTGASLSPGTNPLSALQPAGFSKLTSIYKVFRIYKYNFSVTATPTQATDTIGLTIVPFGYEDSGDVIGLSQNELMSLPYSKAIMATSSNNIVKNKITNSMMPRTVLGMTKLQYKDEQDTAGTSTAAPNSGTFALCTYNTLDGADLGAKLFFEVKIRFWLEFFDPLEDLGVT